MQSCETPTNLPPCNRVGIKLGREVSHAGSGGGTEFEDSPSQDQQLQRLAVEDDSAGTNIDFCLWGNRDQSVAAGLGLLHQVRRFESVKCHRPDHRQKN